MSTIKVNNIEPFSGGTVNITGATIESASYALTASFALNAGGGSDLSSYTGSINQTGGTTTLNGDLNVSTNFGNQTLSFTGGGLGVFGGQVVAGNGVFIPYTGAQQNMTVFLSGSKNYSIGGFDFDGKSYGQIFSNADGGFKVVDGAPLGTFPDLTIQSDNGSINLRTQTTGSTGNINNTITGNASFVAQNSNTRFSVYAGGPTGVGMGISPTFGGPGVSFGGNIDSTYGVNIYNSSNFNQDSGMALDLNAAAGTGTNKIGIFSNFGGPGYQDIMSWQDANNYTDGALQVHQILKVDGSNNAPGQSLQVKDGAGTPRLDVNNAQLKALAGVDVVMNGTALVTEGLQLPSIGDYVDDAAAATGGVPVGGVYRTGSVLKIRVS